MRFGLASARYHELELLSVHLVGQGMLGPAGRIKGASELRGCRSILR